jgi:hypothetical protein
MTNSARTPAAERMQLHRERRRRGLGCFMIELRETGVGALIRGKKCVTIQRLRKIMVSPYMNFIVRVASSKTIEHCRLPATCNEA